MLTRQNANRIIFTCIPIMAYIKNNMAMSRQTYGSALKDWTKVQSSILIVYPCRSNLIKRAARNSRRKPTLNEFSCLREKGDRKSAFCGKFSSSSTYSQLKHQRINYTAYHCYKIKYVPRVLEEVLMVWSSWGNKILN